MDPIRVAILTVSDKGYAGIREDKSGPHIAELLREVAQIHSLTIVPDERDQIAHALIRLCESGEVDMVLTTGGTGFTPRDVTPEATLDVVERLVPGIPEAIRAYSMQFTNRAMLSRGTAGIRKQTLIVNLPGSPKAVGECIDVLRPVLDHIADTLRGDTYECART